MLRWLIKSLINLRIFQCQKTFLWNQSSSSWLVCFVACTWWIVHIHTWCIIWWPQNGQQSSQSTLSTYFFNKTVLLRDRKRQHNKYSICSPIPGGAPTLARRVPILDGGTYLGWGVPTLGDPTPCRGTPLVWTDWKHYLPLSFGCGR